MFSVVLPTYNSGVRLDEAIESVLAQTDPDLELLVVDDCSEDDTLERSQRWARRDGRVRVLRTRRNTGAPATPRNIGLDVANGDFVAFIDHDDTWDRDKLAVQRSLFSEAPWALVYSNCRIESADPAYDGLLWHDGLCKPHGGDVLGDLINVDFVPMLTVVLRTEWARRVGSFRVANGMSDWHYWLRLAMLGGRFGYVPDVLGTYRIHGSNLTLVHSTPRLLAAAQVFEDLAQEFPAYRAAFRRRERDLRRDFTASRLLSVPRPLRDALASAALPPRLWFAGERRYARLAAAARARVATDRHGDRAAATAAGRPGRP